MKKLLIFLSLLNLTTFAQNKADDVIGYYMNPSGEAIIKIYKLEKKYHGKLVWMKNPDKLDIHNPDESKHTTKIFGSTIMKDFEFDGDKTWSGGSIYDPKNGKTYSCKITRDEKENLYIRGYIGISLLGRTDYFVKVNFKEQ